MKNRRCVLCGHRGKLTKHHLHFPKSRFKDRPNYKKLRQRYVMLCTDCHPALHQFYNKHCLKRCKATLINPCIYEKICIFKNEEYPLGV